MQVHGDDHRQEHHRVVEQVQLDAGQDQLQDAGRHGLAGQEVAGLRLQQQQQVLDVVPELDAERDHPPGRLRPVKPLRSRNSPSSMTSA
jgi:hypothetical protein